MCLGTRITPRDDGDYRMWAQLGVTHVCVDPPGNPHHWSLKDLQRHHEHVERFGYIRGLLDAQAAAPRSG